MQFLSEFVGAFVICTSKCATLPWGEMETPVSRCNDVSVSSEWEYIVLAEFGLGLIASKSHYALCHPSPALQTFLFVSPPGPVPPTLMVWWWYPGPGPAPLSGPDLELVVAILTSLPAESVLVRDPGQSAVTTITSGSQQAVSQQIVAPQIIRDIVEWFMWVMWTSVKQF